MRLHRSEQGPNLDGCGKACVRLRAGPAEWILSDED